MRKSKYYSKKWFTIMAAVLVFTVGLCASALSGCGKAGDEGTASTKNVSGSDEKQSGSGTVENKNQDNQDSATDSSADTDKNADKNTDNNTDESKSDSNENSAANSVSTYEASYQEDDTIHRYEVILQACTWQDAYQYCIDRGGYLVRINSNAEYETIRKKVVEQDATNILLYIGGRRDSGSQDYYWVNQNNQLFGDKLNDANSWSSDEWQQGEPSFQDGTTEELYMNLFFLDKEKRFVWNDIPNDMLAVEPAYSGVIGYICEYED